MPTKVVGKPRDPVDHDMPPKKNSLLSKLKTDVVLCAEGYLFELERRGHLKAGHFVPEVVLEKPQVVAQLHEEFVDAGSDVALALTYYANRSKMKDAGRASQVEKLNRAALRIAKTVARKNRCLMAGNICNTWQYKPNDARCRKIVRAMYDEQVGWAKEEGADFVVAETLEYVGEALTALEVIQSHGLPALISFGAHDGSKTEDGHTWADACRILEDHGADVVGLNCTRGPKTMLPILRRIVKKVQIPVCALPVAYGTHRKQPTFQQLRNGQEDNAFPLNLDRFTLTRQEAAQFAVEARESGVRYIGLCCGAAPHHIRAMAEALGRKPKASRYSPDMKKHPVLGQRADYYTSKP